MACFFYWIGDTGGRDNMLQKTNRFDQIKSRKIVDFNNVAATTEACYHKVNVQLIYLAFYINKCIALYL